ncbi:MAG: transposase [Akkermansia sp.]
MINTAMLIERAQHLQADSYQRSPEKTRYANGFKKKPLLISMGKLDLQVPQVRNSEFRQIYQEQWSITLSLSYWM